MSNHLTETLVQRMSDQDYYDLWPKLRSEYFWWATGHGTSQEKERTFLRWRSLIAEV